MLVIGGLDSDSTTSKKPCSSKYMLRHGYIRCCVLVPPQLLNRSRALHNNIYRYSDRAAWVVLVDDLIPTNSASFFMYIAYDIVPLELLGNAGVMSRRGWDSRSAWSWDLHYRPVAPKLFGVSYDRSKSSLLPSYSMNEVRATPCSAW
jgi:hypothetical protein